MCLLYHCEPDNFEGAHFDVALGATYNNSVETLKTMLVTLGITVSMVIVVLYRTYIYTTVQTAKQK